jgi:hypothetical protein
MKLWILICYKPNAIVLFGRCKAGTEGVGISVRLITPIRISTGTLVTLAFNAFPQFHLENPGIIL